MGFDKSFEHSEMLFDAALHEFADKGYEQASINAILQRAGMSKGQFYYHFQSKEALYFALIEALIARKQAHLAETMRPEVFQADLFTIFRTQIHHGLDFARQYPAIHRFAERFVREKGTAIYRKVLAKYNWQNNNAMDDLIAQAYQRGELRTDLPLPFVQTLIGALFTHAAELANLHDAANFEENLAHLIEFMRTGLVACPPAPASGADAQEEGVP